MQHFKRTDYTSKIAKRKGKLRSSTIRAQGHSSESRAYTIALQLINSWTTSTTMEAIWNWILVFTALKKGILDWKTLWIVPNYRKYLSSPGMSTPTRKGQLCWLSKIMIISLVAPTTHLKWVRIKVKIYIKRWPRLSCIPAGRQHYILRTHQGRPC